MGSCLNSCCHCSMRTHLSLQIVFLVFFLPSPQLLPWCRHGFIPTCVCGGMKTFWQQCEMMTLSTSLGNGVQWDIITRVILARRTLCGMRTTQENAQITVKALSELRCFLFFPFPRRPWRQHCAHVKTEREAIVIEMDLCLSLGKRQNRSFPAEPCARCWRGLPQRATLMSQRSWIVLLSALTVSRPLCRPLCFVRVCVCECLFVFFNNIISTYHDESAKVRQTERET